MFIFQRNIRIKLNIVLSTTRICLGFYFRKGILRINYKSSSLQYKRIKAIYHFRIVHIELSTLFCCQHIFSIFLHLNIICVYLYITVQMTYVGYIYLKLCFLCLALYLDCKLNLSFIGRNERFIYSNHNSVK
jgi:hypothetical protein